MQHTKIEVDEDGNYLVTANVTYTDSDAMGTYRLRVSSAGVIIHTSALLSSSKFSELRHDKWLKSIINTLYAFTEGAYPVLHKVFKEMQW